MSWKRRFYKSEFERIFLVVMKDNKILYKNNPKDKIQWVEDPNEEGVWEFTFDGKTFFNMFRDYPEKLTPEQKEIFDKENPYWKDFFKDRQ